MADDPEASDQPPEGFLYPGRGEHYQTGTGLGAVFWLVAAVPFAIVGIITSGVVHDVFWGLAGLGVLLAVLNFGLFVAGKDRGGWKD